MSMVIFQGASGFGQMILERSAELKIVGGALAAGSAIVAWLRKDAWNFGGQRFERIICKGPVRLELHSSSETRSLGPFPELTIDGDALCTREGVLARYDAFHEKWRFERNAESETMVLRDAAEPPHS